MESSGTNSSMQKQYYLQKDGSIVKIVSKNSDKRGKDICIFSPNSKEKVKDKASNKKVSKLEKLLSNSKRVYYLLYLLYLIYIVIIYIGE